MTSKEYWDDDCWLTKYFLDAEKKRYQHENYVAWLNGAYIYRALTDVSPILMQEQKKALSRILIPKSLLKLKTKRKKILKTPRGKRKKRRAKTQKPEL